MDYSDLTRIREESFKNHLDNVTKIAELEERLRFHKEKVHEAFVIFGKSYKLIAISIVILGLSQLVTQIVIKVVTPPPASSTVTCKLCKYVRPTSPLTCAGGACTLSRTPMTNDVRQTRYVRPDWLEEGMTVWRAAVAKLGPSGLPRLTDSDAIKWHLRAYNRDLGRPGPKHDGYSGALYCRCGHGRLRTCRERFTQH